MLDSDCMGRDMHSTDKNMLTMPGQKEISQRVKSISLLDPSIHIIQCSRKGVLGASNGKTWCPHGPWAPTWCPRPMWAPSVATLAWCSRTTFLLHQTLQLLWATTITRGHSNNEFTYNSVVKKSLK
jgi:hypothetical protein